MSFVIAAPEFVAAAASDLANIGSTINAANAAAMVPTSGVLAAGADEVSAAIAGLFGAHAQAYQALSAQRSGGVVSQPVRSAHERRRAQYATTETANASPLQAVGDDLLRAVNAPTQALVGRPLIRNGANGAAGNRREWPARRDIDRLGGAGGSGSACHPAGGNGGAGGAVRRQRRCRRSRSERHHGRCPRR